MDYSINATQYLEQFKKALKTKSDKEISEVIPYGAMQYTEEVAQTVSFAFWICFMAEQDLNTALQEAWKLAKAASPEMNHEKIDETIEKDHKIKVHKIDLESKSYNKREVTFGDLIYIRERLFGKTDFVKLLWKLKTLRDDLSHGRIGELNYNGENLSLRSTKEILLVDYFTLAQEGKLDLSPVWGKLTEEDRKDIKEKFDQMISNTSHE